MGEDAREQGRLRMALQAGRMGTWEWHVQDGRVVWSPTLELIHGIPEGSFPGTLDAYQSDIHPEDRERVLARSPRFRRPVTAITFSSIASCDPTGRCAGSKRMDTSSAMPPEHPSA